MEQRLVPVATPSPETEAHALNDEIMRVFQSLRRSTQLRFLAYLTWEVEDGRPETDPRNDDPEWQAFARRRASG